MKAVRSTRQFFYSVLTLALVGGLVACENPVEDDHEEHPVGLAILNSQGQVVASVSEGQAVTGQITVAHDATQTFTLVAIAEDGDQLPLTDELGARIKPSRRTPRSLCRAASSGCLERRKARARPRSS